MSSTSFIQYDSNGTPVPVPPPTRTHNHTNKFVSLVNSRLWHCNSDPHRLLPYTVSPENDVLPPGTPLQRNPHPLPRLDTIWNAGSHMTHLLDSNGELVEYRAQFQTQLNQLLSEQGFPAEHTTGLLTERSAIRKVGNSWKPAKIYVGAINQTQSLFVAGELDLEGYSSKLAALLDPEGRTDVYGFLATIADSLADMTYCSESKFGAKLKKDFITFRDDGVSTVADAEDEDSGDAAQAEAKSIVIEGTNKIAGSTKIATREHIEKSFVDLKNNVYGAEDVFYTAAYKLVLGKVLNKMYDAAARGECTETHEDIAGDIMMQLFKNISKVNNIYPYLCKLAWNQGKAAFTNNIEDRKKHVPVVVEVEDGGDEAGGNSGPYKEQNLLLNPKDYPIEFRRKLPAFIQGVDLQICDYIREGYDYGKIADVLSMKESAVAKRVQGMRKQIEEMRVQGFAV
jgi:hypothetical protein